MRSTTQGRLATDDPVLRWLLTPMEAVGDVGRAFLLGQLLGAPAASIMVPCCTILVCLTAVLHSGDTGLLLIPVAELALLTWRITDWRVRLRKARTDPDFVPAVDTWVRLSIIGCTFQGVLAFRIMSGSDSVMHVLSATLVMGMIGPICARNYVAPRFALLLVLLCDLPFIAGAMLSDEPWLKMILPIALPFLMGTTQIIRTLHRAMLLALRAEAHSDHLARHDSLTGILNRQGMDEALCHITPDGNRQMALLCIDLDGFKQVNDRHGHGAGDMLLIHVAERIRAEVRAGDLVGRMGGDEFMVVMRDMPPDRVGPLVERLIAVISDRPYEVEDGTSARVGASIGFACLPEDAVTTVELRLRADRALYAAKGAGKGVGQRYGITVQGMEAGPCRGHHSYSIGRGAMAAGGA